MGYMRHHAIVVTSWSGDIVKAQKNAELYCPGLVSPIVDSRTNSYRSFFIAPDGSKEGWDRSDEGDWARGAFIRWLEDQEYDDGSSMFGWVEVQYDDDDNETMVTRSSDARQKEGTNPMPGESVDGEKLPF